MNSYNDSFNIYYLPKLVTLVFIESICEKYIWSEYYRTEKGWLCGTNIDLNVYFSEIAIFLSLFQKGKFQGLFVCFFFHNKI